MLRSSLVGYKQKFTDMKTNSKSVESFPTLFACHNSSQVTEAGICCILVLLFSRRKLLVIFSWNYNCLGSLISLLALPSCGTNKCWLVVHPVKKSGLVTEVILIWFSLAYLFSDKERHIAFDSLTYKINTRDQNLFIMLKITKKHTLILRLKESD